MDAKQKLDADETATLVKLYHEQDLAVDRLPYTDNFNQMVEAFRQICKPQYNNVPFMLYSTLVHLRKSGKLVKKTNRRARRKPVSRGTASLQPQTLTEEDATVLKQIIDSGAAKPKIKVQRR